jgi:dihydropteroate synthase
MGILNVTPDSFSDGGKHNTVAGALAHAEALLAQGASILDIGGYSSRPGAVDISPEEEMGRVLPVIQAIRREFPDALMSIDTFRTKVASAALDEGVHILNDITAGGDVGMFALAARHRAPMILMHMQGTPQTMQVSPNYGEVVAEVSAILQQRVADARQQGVTDLLLDPGFGFGKTLAHNYDLFRALPHFASLQLPLVVGISRKSMIWKLVGATPHEVGDLTTALHLKALEAGASVLRVHDVASAARAIQLHKALRDGTF